MVFGIAYIYYSNLSYMVINLWGIDEYESNRTGDGQTDGQTRTRVHMGKIYENGLIKCRDPWCHGTSEINDTGHY